MMEAAFIQFLILLAAAAVIGLVGFVIKNTLDIAKLKATTERLVKSSEDAEAKKRLDLLKALECLNEPNE